MGEIEYFDLLSNSTIKDLEDAYKSKKEKIYNSLFIKGRAGQMAADQMAAIEERYLIAKKDIINRNFSEGNSEMKYIIENYIKNGKTEELQSLLDEITDKNAYWNYLEAIVLYMRKLYFQSLAYLEKAVALDPNNVKYKEAILKIEMKILLLKEEGML